MAKKTPNQIKQLIDNSKRILITTSKQFSGDGLASCIALSQFFKKLNKNCGIVIDSFELPQEYKFLSEIEQIKPEVKKLKKYLINLDISQTGIEELAYDIQGDNLRIHLSPQRGVLTPDDLKFQTSEFSFDLIFIVNTPDLESLGSLYDHHRDLFYQIPVVNIDNSASNDNYGHVNLVDITATSSAEIIYRLIKDLELEVLDSKIADCLLTGMIVATRSFKTENVTPESLTIASELINLGANRQEIVTRLFQTKTISTLKLWGKVLTRLQSDQTKKIIWSKLDPHDFTETGASPKNLHGVVDELISASPLAEVIALFYQTEPQTTQVILYAQRSKNALMLSRKYLSSGDKNYAHFNLDKSLDEAEAEIIGHLKSQI
ncbi:DHH family phosphoesterase [Patescibacteria group bacterium]|nr:DHH family phosphoesterase [Patescibacteria group bacterium]